MIYSIKRFVRSGLGKIGIEIQRIKPTAGKVHRIGNDWDIEPIRAQQITARTVIDVGAAGGTPTLHRAFPDAYFVLVEPLKEFEPDLRNILSGGRGEIIWSAAGAQPGTALINVNQRVPMQSSLGSRTSGFKTTPREIKIDTLDNLLGDKTLDTPIVLKVDVEGLEADVLRGGTNTLAKCAAVIIEVTGDKGYANLNNNFRQVDELLRSAGFGLSAILNATVNKLNVYVIKADMLYVRR